jgi:hypothetical protein
MVAENPGTSAEPGSSDSPADLRAGAQPSTSTLRPRRGTQVTRPAAESRLPLGASPARNAMMGAAMVGYAWLLAGTAPFSTRALLGVLLPGAVLGVIAYGRPPERIPPPDSVDVTGFSYWVVCIALLFEWEASAVRDGRSPSVHPSLTDLINPLIAPHPVKTAAIVAWLLSGWALVRR